MSGELNHQEFRELVLDAYLTDPIPPITCMTDKALMRLEQLLRERYEAEAKSRREATLHVCHLKDAVCSERPSSWCDKCPKRPAAQTEREAFEAWARPNGYDLRRNDVLGHYSSIDTSRAWDGFRAGRASLPAPQQATPAEEFKTINCQVNGIDGTAEVRRVDENTVDIGRVVAFADEQQATPEPVGEPFGYFRALPFGWEQCGEHDDGAVALYDRPAPGVPEDVQRDAERLDWLTFNISGKALRDIGVMWGEHANARAAIDAAMLAAAQAKGGAA